jgi:plastocyanin
MRASSTAIRRTGATRVIGGAALSLAMLGAASSCADDPSDLRATGDATADAGGDVGDTGDGADDLATGVVIEVQSLDNTFRPAELTVEVGTEVVFDNVGRNEHNVIPEPGGLQGWGVGEDRFAPGDRYSHVFTEPGVYEYVCTIHGVNRKGMVGTITVTG